jgi:ADP-ribose pyrophosphatase YjhB (NUDIX family)
MVQTINKQVTVRVSGILINDKQELLLVKHRKNNREYYVLPGGHLDFGETLEECIVRELKEEVLLETECKKIIAISQSIAPDGSRHIINFYVLLSASNYECKLSEAEEIVVGAEYISLSKLSETPFYPDIREFILNSVQEKWSQDHIVQLNTPWA